MNQPLNIDDLADRISRRLQQKLRRHLTAAPKVGDPEAFGRAVCESLGVGFAGIEAEPDGSFTVEMKPRGITEADVLRALEEIAEEDEVARIDEMIARVPEPLIDTVRNGREETARKQENAAAEFMREAEEADPRKAGEKIAAVLYDDEWYFAVREEAGRMGYVWVDLDGDEVICRLGEEGFFHDLGSWSPHHGFKSLRRGGR